MTLFERCRRLAEASRTLVGLPPGDRAPFARAYLLQLAWAMRGRLAPRLGLRWLPTDEPMAPEAPEAGTAPDERLLALFRRAEALQVVSLGCLPRALALGRHLANNGCRTRLVLGVRRGPQGIEGHAWRAWGERVLGGEEHARGFEPLHPPSGHAHREGSEAR